MGQCLWNDHKSYKQMEVAKFLELQLNIPTLDAASCTKIFLKNFQSCPEHPGMSLDKWRLTLWSEALGSKYTHIAETVYKVWLELRMEHLLPSNDILSLLHWLHSHYSLALITNGPSCAQWEKIDVLGFQHLFDCILVSGDLPWEKPHKAIFLEACRQLQTKPQNCLMVGDKLETDICGAMSADFGATVWIPLGGQQETDPRPDFILNSVLELPEVLSLLLASNAVSFPYENSSPFTLQTDTPDKHKNST